MHDLGDRLAKVAVAPTGSAIAKRQKVAAELKGVSNLVEEMLSIAKESYSASLAASQMGHLAFEHTVTITELRTRIAELQTEIRCWVERSSQDATAAMILDEDNKFCLPALALACLCDKLLPAFATSLALACLCDKSCSCLPLRQVLPAFATSLACLCDKS